MVTAQTAHTWPRHDDILEWLQAQTAHTWLHKIGHTMMAY